MNLFRMASRGVDLDALPDDEAPRSLIDFGPISAPASRMAVPQELDSLFDAAASEYGVDPTILKGIAYAESEFQPDIINGKVKSPAGAVGLMQFLPTTAKEMGIDPLDPAEAVFGAAAYLRKSLDKFGGDTERAIASYNWGPNRDAFARDDWYKALPAETRKYVGKVLEFADGVSFKPPPPVQGVKVPLPEGVSPSAAGAGRGTLDDPRNLTNPENAPQAPFYERVLDSALTLGKGAAASNPVLGRMLNIASGPKDKPLNSVLEGMQLTGTPTDLAEAERLSRRDYAENAERARFGKQAEMRAPVAATGAQAFAEANPIKAALKGDAARTMGGVLNLPSVVAGLGAETVNRLATDAGGGPVFGRVGNMPLVNDLRKVTQDYSSSLARKSPDQAWDNGEFGRWMMTQLSGNTLSAGMSLAALFLPGAQATLLGSMGATAAGSAYADGDSASAAALKGLVEVGSEKLPLSAAEKIKDLVLAIPAPARNQVLAEAGKRLLAAGTAVSANSLVGAIEETAAEIGGNVIDKYVQGKNKGVFDEVDRAALVGAAFGGGMSAPAVAQIAAGPESMRARELSKALNDGGLPPGATVEDALRTGQNNTAQINPVATSMAAAAGETARLQTRPVPTVESQPTTPQAPVIAAATEVAPKVQAIQPAPIREIAGAQPVEPAVPNVSVESQPAPISELAASAGDIARQVLSGEVSPAAPIAEQAPTTVEQAEQQLAEREAPPQVEMQMRPAGTLLVKGDPAAIRARLLPAGVDSAIDVPGGLVVSRTQAAKAQEVLSAPTQPAVTPQQEVANVPQGQTPQTQPAAQTPSAQAPVVERADAAVPASAVPAARGSSTAQADGVGAPVAAPTTEDLAALYKANGPYPPSAATRIGEGQWQPAVKTGPASGRPIEGAPTFSNAGSATAWAKYEQAKSRDGANVEALQRLQENLNANTPAPAVRMADASRPGAVTPASDTTGQQGGDARGVGRIAAGQPDTAGAPRPAVREAVSDAGGNGAAGSVDARQFSRGKNPGMATTDVVGDSSDGSPADDSTTGTDENTGLPLNADGTVTLYHHTSKEKAAEIQRTGKLKAAAEPDVYVTTRKDTDTGYGDTAVAIRVKPDRLQIDDEFPNGRVDYRLNVGRPGGSIAVKVESNEPSASASPDAPPAFSKGATNDAALSGPSRATKESVNVALAQLVPTSGRLPNGLGKVVVANASEIKPNWEPLIGPVDMASEDAGQAQGFYDPRTRTVFLIADHIKAGTEMAVAAHELMHKHGQAVLGADGWNKLHSTIERWANAPANSTERLVYDEAASRVEASRPSDISIPEYSTQELFPYAVQIAMEMGVQPSTGKPAGTVAGWLARVRNALKDAWTKITGKPDLFDSQDLVDLAFGIAQRENPERMIDVSLDALDNALPNERNTLSYDRATGQFRSNDGNVVQPRASAMGRSLDDYRAGVGKAQAGWRTLARAAYLRSFRGADGRAEGSGILDQSSDDVSRFRGGTVGSAFADPKSRIFYSRDGRDETVNTAPQGVERERTAVPEETRARRVQRVLQDKFNRITVLRNWATENNIELSPESDVWGYEARMHGTVATRVEDFREETVKPLIERIQKAGYSMEQVAEYLQAQHAEERNAQIESIDPAIKDGSGMTNAEAKAILAKAPAGLAPLASEVQAITGSTRQILLDAGIISQEMADAWDAAYKNYVPLKGGDEVKQGGTGKGLSVDGRQKRALGHGARDEKIVENILRDHERAIMLAEKNKIGQSLLVLVDELNNPEIATIGQPEKRRVLKQGSMFEARTTDGIVVDSFATQQQALNFVTSHPDMKLAVKKVTADPMVVSMASPMLGPNEVQVYLQGHAVRVQLNDELLSRAYQNLGPENFTVLMKINREVNAAMSKMYTALNPEFFAKNVLRDFTAGLTITTAKYGAGVAARAVKNYPKAMAQLLHYGFTKKASPALMSYRLAGGSTGAAYLGDLQRIGEDVQATFDDARGVAATTKADGAWRGTRSLTRKALKAGLKYIEILNAAGESAMRLSVFEAMRETGHDVRDAASASKELMNFNRQGEATRTVGGWYLFLNASIQGTAAISDALVNGKNREQGWAMVAGMAGLFYALAAAQFGDDDEGKKAWERISQDVKSKNLIIRTGPDSYATIPIPYGLGAFFGIGNAAYDLQRGEDLDKVALHLALNFADHFLPVKPYAEGGDTRGLVELVPGVAGGELMRAALRAGVNRSGLGGDIVPDSKFDEGKPDNLRAYRNTRTSVFQTIATQLNEASGGTPTQAGLVDVSPESLKYWTRTLTGGAGVFLADTFDAVKRRALYHMNPGDPDREALLSDAREIPVMRGFVRDDGISDDRRQYWTAARDVATSQQDSQRARKAGDEVGLQKVEDRRGELLYLVDAMKRNSGHIKEIRDEVEEVMLDESTSMAFKRAAVKKLEAEESAIYREFVEMVNEDRAEAKKDRASAATPKR